MIDINWAVPYPQWILTLVFPTTPSRWQPFASMHDGWECIDVDLAITLLGAMSIFPKETRWLSNDQKTAVDLVFSPVDPVTFESLYAYLDTCFEGYKVDWHITPNHPDWPREKRLLISDMDSTLLEGECIDELAAGVGVKDHVSAITARAMRGELNFEQALTERVSLLKGLSTDYVQHVLDETPLIEGAKTLTATMRFRGAYTMIVSGGFTPFTASVCKTLNMHDHQANTLEVDGDSFTGHVIPPILGQDAKQEALVSQLTKMNLSYQHAIAIGDGANDLKMLVKSGLGIAFHAKAHVQGQSRARIRFGDLSVALYYQGIPQREWV